MEIQNCNPDDINMILYLHESARTLQMNKKMVVWPVFESRFIEKEITEKRQWKITSHNTIACNWAVTFNDIEIWGEMEKGDAIYLHRICTNPSLRGNRYIDQIVDWSKEYSRQLGRKFVRLDTLGNNKKLIEHYTSAGFDFLGIVHLPDTSNLPAHYHNEPDCLRFELTI